MPILCPINKSAAAILCRNWLKPQVVVRYLFENRNGIQRSNRITFQTHLWHAHSFHWGVFVGARELYDSYFRNNVDVEHSARCLSIFIIGLSGVPEKLVRRVRHMSLSFRSWVFELLMEQYEMKDQQQHIRYSHRIHIKSCIRETFKCLNTCISNLETALVTLTR